MQKEKLAWKQRVYCWIKPIKDIIKSKLKYKNADDLTKEVNDVIADLQEKIIKLEADKNALAVCLDKCRHHCWDYRKENQILRASGRSLSIED